LFSKNQIYNNRHLPSFQLFIPTETIAFTLCLNELLEFNFDLESTDGLEHHNST